MNDLTRTVAAISTPPGKGGVAVIRISGSDAHKIVEKCFVPRSGKGVAEYGRGKMIYGDILLDGEKIDDGMVALFFAPASYTGENVAEIFCHGGSFVTGAVLTAVLSSGAYPAGAGEFTRRAVMNGKMSLTQAEAIGDLLDAQSMAQVRLSSAESRTRFSAEIEGVCADIRFLMASIFARIDYPDEDLAELSDGQITARLSDISRALDELISTYRTGRAVNEGIKTVICGKPNAGKSTLYNLLVGEDRAIVTEHEGTTRDVLVERVPLGNVMLTLFDTAGLRSTDDPVEKIGVERSYKCISEAELVLAVFDGSRPLCAEDERLIFSLAEMEKTTVAVINKGDLTPDVQTVRQIKNSFENVVEMSARDGGADALRKMTEGLFIDEKIRVGTDAVVANARQHSALLRAREHIGLAYDAFESGFPCDVAASDIELALGAMAELDGREVSESVVGEIFSHFCVGK